MKSRHGACASGRKARRFKTVHPTASRIMWRRASVVSVLILCGVAACDSNPGAILGLGGQPALRIINAFTAPVDVLVDGQVAVSGLAAGAIDTIGPSLGAH